MSLKKIFPLLLICLSLLFVSCASISGFGKDAKQRLSAKYETVSIDEKLEYLETEIKYPQFEKFPDLNKRISNLINSEWKNFKSYSKQDWYRTAELNERGKGKLNPYSYNVTCKVTGNKQIVSVLIETWVFSGGAHGNTSLIALNYDIASGKYLNITQVSEMTYNQISEICRNKLYKDLIDSDKTGMPPSEKDLLRDMINTGAFPQAGNFEIFTVDGSKITVWFEPYSVAPYSYGIQEIQIK